MPVIFGFLTKLLPFLSPLAEKFFPASSREKEIRAEKELVEARAFARGRLSPKYLMWYIVAFTFVALVVLAIIEALVPGTVSVPFGDKLREIIKFGLEVVGQL